MYKISIITVTYNAGNLLRKTIESVAMQDCKDFEYIIIDGGSKDNTRTIVSENTSLIRTFVSEKDDGIYDAMNKGIQLAEGEYCMFLNAGDMLYDSDTLLKASELINEETADVYFADAVYTKWREADNYFIPQLSKIPFRFCHQAMFFKTSLLKKNLYDVGYRLSGDSELIYRLYEKGVIFKYLSIPLVKELAGEGATERNLITSTRELYSIPYLKKNMPFYEITYNKAKIAIYCFLRKIHFI